MRKLLMMCGILALTAIPAFAQHDYPSAEVFGGYSLLHVRFLGAGVTAHGFGGSVAANLGPRFGIVGDFSYNRKFGTGVFVYTAGPQISFRGKSATGFVHVLVGGARVFGVSGFTFGFGGGIDVNAGKHLAVRVAQFDYLPSRFSGVWIHGYRYEAGVVFKIGGK